MENNGPVRANELDLTEQESAMLKDPEWVDGDEADAIMALRIERGEAATAIPIRQYMAERAKRKP